MNLIIDLSKVSLYRTQLMGIAAILIVLCHASLYGVQMCSVLSTILNIGNIGVDVFLFLSGMGCYYSLNKPKSGGMLSWYKRRFLRIFIPYTLSQIPFWGFYIINGNFDFFDSLYEFSTLSFWTRHTGMWYIALLIPLYILTPSLYYLFERTKYRLLLGFILIMLVLLLCSINIRVDNASYNNIIDNLQWAFRRTASFILGIAISPAIKKGMKINGMGVIICSVITLLVLKYCGLSHNWCLFPIIIVLSIVFLDNLSIDNLLNHFLCMIGMILLESYLYNGYVRYMFMDSSIYTCNSPVFLGHYLDYNISLYYK